MVNILDAIALNLIVSSKEHKSTKPLYVYLAARYLI